MLCSTVRLFASSSHQVSWTTSPPRFASRGVRSALVPLVTSPPPRGRRSSDHRSTGRPGDQDPSGRKRRAEARGDAEAGRQPDVLPAGPRPPARRRANSDATRDMGPDPVHGLGVVTPGVSVELPDLLDVDVSTHGCPSPCRSRCVCRPRRQVQGSVGHARGSGASGRCPRGARARRRSRRRSARPGRTAAGRLGPLPGGPGSPRQAARASAAPPRERPSPRHRRPEYLGVCARWPEGVRPLDDAPSERGSSRSQKATGAPRPDACDSPAAARNATANVSAHTSSAASDPMRLAR